MKHWHGESGSGKKMMNLKEMLKISCQVSKTDWIEGIEGGRSQMALCFQAEESWTLGEMWH